MTPKIIELKQAPVVLVELPYQPMQIIDGLDRTKIHYRNEVLGDWITIKNIPEFDSILGILSDLTEEQFAECVVSSVHTGLFAHYAEGVIPPNAFSYKTAKESFQTLLESEQVYTENPYEDLAEPKSYSEIRKMSTPELMHDYVVWQEAQSRTINPERTVVLIRKEEKK